MSIFYILSALLLAASALWLRREDRGRTRFACALYLLLLYDGVRLATVWGGLEDARRAEQAKVAFLTTVSHELRTPLTSLPQV